MREEAVGGGLRDDAGEHGCHLGRRLAVGVGQPAVERPERRLDGEGGREAEEDPRARSAPAQLRHVERPGIEAGGDDRDQHQQRAGDRVGDELERRPQPSRPAPDADEDVERDQHGLPEDVEEDEVLGGEDADGRALEEEQQAEVDARALAAGPEAVPDHGGRDDDGQPDQPERVVVEADLVGDVEVGEPADVDLVLEAGAGEVEVERRADPERQLAERDEEREAAGRPRVLQGRIQSASGRGDREEDEESS